MLLPGRGILFPLKCRSPLTAVIADILPVVSGQFYMPVRSTYRHFFVPGAHLLRPEL